MLDRNWLPIVLLSAFVAASASVDSAYAEPATADATAEVADESELGEDSHDGDHDGDGGAAGRHGADDHDGHDAAGHSEAAPDPLSTDPDLALWTLGVFVLMLAILSKVAWKPIMAALQEREDKIDGAIASAGEKLKEAESLLAKHQAELAGAADQVRGLLEEARRDADATIAQAKTDAKAEFEAERQRATRDIEQASDAAVRQLAEKTAGLAIDLAGRVVKKDLSSDRQSEIVREALGRFAKSDPSAN